MHPRKVDARRGTCFRCAAAGSERRVDATGVKDHVDYLTGLSVFVQLFDSGCYERAARKLEITASAIDKRRRGPNLARVVGEAASDDAVFTVEVGTPTICHARHLHECRHRRDDARRF